MTVEEFIAVAPDVLRAELFSKDPWRFFPRQHETDLEKHVEAMSDMHAEYLRSFYYSDRGRCPEPLLFAFLRSTSLVKRYQGLADLLNATNVSRRVINRVRAIAASPGTEMEETLAVDILSKLGDESEHNGHDMG